MKFPHPCILIEPNRFESFFGSAMGTIAVLIAGWVLVATRAPAGVIATENFDYASGSVVGQTGGTGWNNEFLDEAGAPAQSPSDWDLAFGTTPTVALGALVTNGGGAKREFGGAGEGGTFPSNEREGAFRGTGKWFMSTTFRVDALFSEGTNQWGGISSFDFGTERIFWGMPGQAGATRYFGVTTTSSSSPSLSTIPIIANTTYILLVMLDFDNDRIAIWVNPDGNDSESTYDAVMAYTGTNWSSAVRLASVNGVNTYWDNVRIATTFAEAMPPPPATWYWDGSATTVNAQSDNTTTTVQNWLSWGNWDNGSTSAPRTSWTPGDSAVFGGSAASQTIPVDNIMVRNLTFGQGPLGAGTSGTAYTLTGGTLTLAGGTVTTNTSATITSVLAGTAGFTKSGDKTLSLNTANTFSGNLVVNGGILQTGTTGGNGSIGYLGAVNGSRTVSINGSGTTVLLQGNNVFGGSGKSAATIPSLSLYMGVLDSTRFNILGNVTLNGGILTQRTTDSGTWEGYEFLGTVSVIGSEVSFIRSSTGKANHLRGGATTIFDVAAGASLIVSAPFRNGSGDYSGAGALQKSGAGTMSLTGANLYTGGTTVAGGTLNVHGSVGGTVTVASGATLGGIGTLTGPVLVNGTLSPGVNAIATLTATGTVTLGASATAVMDVKSIDGVLTNDKLQGINTLTYGGTLTVVRDQTGVNLGLGNRFTLFTASSYAGSFSAFNLPALGAGLFWDTSRLAVDGSIAVSSSSVANPPVFTPPAGGYAGTVSVAITAGSGATIYYTTDGSTPTAASPHGISPVTGIVVPTDATVTLKAYAAEAGLSDSPVTTSVYRTVTTPTWIFAGGGSWIDPSSWQSGVIAGGSGTTADFSTTNLLTDGTLTLNGARTIGTLLFGDTTPSHNWELYDGTQGPLTLDTPNGTPRIAVANQMTTIGATLAGSKGFVKSGTGILRVTGANSISGGIIVSQGELRTNGNAATGSASLTLGDANTGAGNLAWLFNGGAAPSTSVLVSAQGTGTVTIGSYSAGSYTEPSGSLTLNRAVILADGSGDRTSFTGKITGNPGTITLTGTRITFSNPANDFTGEMVVSDGTIYQDNAAGAIPDGVSVNLNGANSRFRLNGYNEAINALTGNGIAELVSGSNLTLTVGAGNGSGVFSGTLQNGSGRFNLAKVGTGTQTLTGANTYNGSTVVSGGSLIITGTLTSPSVTIASGATLGGTGTLDGSVTVNGTLAPGVGGIGTLVATGTVTFSASTVAAMEIKSSGGVLTADLIGGATTLTYAGTLNVTRDPASDDFAAGDRFTLFYAFGYGYHGSFSTLNLPALGAGLFWDTSRLAVDGSLGVSNGTGMLDTAFAPGLSTPFGFAVQPDRKIMLAGWFATVGGVARSGLARIGEEGTLDTGFNPTANDQTFCTAIQADGKILIGGEFTTIDNVYHVKIARLQADGTLDAGFDASTDFTVYSVNTQPDGKILLAGNFNTINGTSRYKVARLNADGTLDTSFINPQINAQVRTSTMLTSGKILIGGAFSVVGGTPRAGLARLNADGTLDTTFVDANANGSVQAAVVQADGKILITGSFTTVRGATRNRIARLNPDGTLDSGFAPSLNDGVLSLALQTDGKIIVTGTFTQANGVNRSGIARFHPDGTLDPALNPYIESGGGTISELGMQADGKLLVAGGFASIDNTAIYGFARLLNEPASQELTVPGLNRIQWLRGGTSPELERASFEVSTNGGVTWTPLGVGQRIKGGWEATGLALPLSGMVRALGVAAGGRFNGSHSLHQAQTSYSLSPPNHSPVFTGYSVTTKMNRALAIAPAKILAHASDPDGDAFTLTRVFSPTAQGGAVVLSGTVNYTPPGGFTGTDSVEFELTDARGATTRGLVAIAVGAETTGAAALGSNLTDMTVRPDGRVSLTFRGIPGRAYLIQRSGDLVVWSTLATVTAGPDGRIPFLDPSPLPGQAFYRTANP